MFRVYDKYDDGRTYYWDGRSWTLGPDCAKLLSQLEASQLARAEQCEYEAVPTPVERVPVTLFILIQNNRVLDYAIMPRFLRIEKLDVYAGFKIAIGRISEWGEREIAGVVVDVAPLSGAKTWRISSDADGLYRLIGASVCPAELVTKRLGVMQGAGKFSDLANLPMRIVLTAFGPTTPLSVENVVKSLVP